MPGYYQKLRFVCGVGMASIQYAIFQITLPFRNLNYKLKGFDAEYDGQGGPFHLTFDRLFPLVSHASELFVAKCDVKHSKMANLNLNKKCRSAPIIA